MTRSIAYTCPFVPPELITACGLVPWRVVPSVTKAARCPGTTAGVCPYVRAFLGEALSGPGLTAIILTTRCDQMRRTGDLIAAAGRWNGTGQALPADLRPGAPSPASGAPSLAQQGVGDAAGPCHPGPSFPASGAPSLAQQGVGDGLFLMNVPSTWQTSAARGLYRSELERLLRFLRDCSGLSTTDEQLVAVMLARSPQQSNGQHSHRKSNGHGGIPLAIVGGPIVQEDLALWDIVEQSGGRIALDATENGERTQPAPFDADRLRKDPIGEMARAYFDAIPDVFRRPNTLLYDWLNNQMTARGVKGILLYRHAWCDLWHAEAHRLRDAFGVPLLDLEMGDADAGRQDRTATRLQAFLEALK